MAVGWTLRGAASVMGSAHELDQTPCQDTHIVRTSPSGAWTGVVVCDGAGSAKFSKKGAEVASQHYADKLMEIATELEQRAPGAWINDALIEGVVHIRHALRAVARQDDLSDYHTTLLAVLVGPTGGVCVHIGDGAIFGGCFAAEDGRSLINANWFLSEPENGEYANETYFITEAGWIKHLRISPLPPLDWIALATDGGAALALTAKNEIKSDFMPGLFQELQGGGTALSPLIQNALLDPALANITGDDKTLAVLVRGGRIPPHPHSFAVAASQITKHFPAVDEAKPLALPPDASSITAAKAVPASLWNDRRSTQKRYPRIIRRIAFIGLVFLALATTSFLAWELYKMLASLISPAAKVQSDIQIECYQALTNGQYVSSADTPQCLK